MAENQRKLEATLALGELADDTGISLIEMSIAFILRHPTITAAIIGPRTMDHLESSWVPLRSSFPMRCSIGSTKS